MKLLGCGAISLNTTAELKQVQWHDKTSHLKLEILKFIKTIQICGATLYVPANQVVGK